MNATDTTTYTFDLMTKEAVILMTILYEFHVNNAIPYPIMAATALDIAMKLRTQIEPGQPFATSGGER